MDPESPVDSSATHLASGSEIVDARVDVPRIPTPRGHAEPVAPEPPVPLWRRAVSTVLVVAFNLVPIWGVFFESWNVFAIVALYWLDVVVFGVSEVLRLRSLSRRTEELSPRPGDRHSAWRRRLVTSSPPSVLVRALSLFWLVSLGFLGTAWASGIDWTVLLLGSAAVVSSHGVAFLSDLARPAAGRDDGAGFAEAIVRTAVMSFAIPFAGVVGVSVPVAGVVLLVSLRTWFEVALVWRPLH